MASSILTEMETKKITNCGGTTVKGKPCKKHVTNDEKYCRYHGQEKEVIQKKDPRHLKFKCCIYADGKCIGKIRNNMILPGRSCNPKVQITFEDKEIELDFYDDFNMNKIYTGILQGSLEIMRFDRIMKIEDLYYRLFICTCYESGRDLFKISNFELSSRKLCKCGAANYNRFRSHGKKITSCNICEGDSDEDKLEPLEI